MISPLQFSKPVVLRFPERFLSAFFSVSCKELQRNAKYSFDHRILRSVLNRAKSCPKFPSPFIKHFLSTSISHIPIFSVPRKVKNSSKWETALESVRDGSGYEYQPEEISNAIKVMGRCGRPVEAQDLLRRLKTISEDESLIFEHGSVVKAFLVAGDLPGALKYLEEMAERGVEPTVGIYNIILNGYASEGDLEMAELLFRRMESKGLKPDIITYNFMLKACSFSKNRLIEAMSWFNRIEFSGFKPNFYSWNIIIDIARRNKSNSLADELYSKALDSGTVNPFISRSTLRNCDLLVDIRNFSIGMALSAVCLELEKRSVSDKNNTLCFRTGNLNKRQHPVLKKLVMEFLNRMGVESTFSQTYGIVRVLNK